MLDYIIATSQNEYEAATKLFREYANWLGIDLCFQHFDEELASLSTMYHPSVGGIVLCRHQSNYIACVGVRKITTEIAELKRMWVQLPFQQQGIGQALLDKALAIARQGNYSSIRLDTLRHMHPAIGLYLKNGFYEIPAYYANPEKEVVYFEKLLNA